VLHVIRPHCCRLYRPIHHHDSSSAPLAGLAEGKRRMREEPLET
jgi:hypothetical protein